MAKGFQQTPRVDYFETFNQVVKAATIKIILCLAVHFNWDIQQIDINNVFLNGDLEEQVYMYQPEGFMREEAEQKLVYKLNKALYGLKQTPRAWFAKLKSVLIN